MLLRNRKELRHSGQRLLDLGIQTLKLLPRLQSIDLLEIGPDRCLHSLDGVSHLLPVVKHWERVTDKVLRSTSEESQDAFDLEL